MTFEISSYGNEYTCSFVIGEYANNNIAISIEYMDEDFNCWMPFATMSVNISKLDAPLVCIDTNNCPWAIELIERLKLGKDTYCVLQSGYCIYPVYEMNLKRIEKYTRINKYQRGKQKARDKAIEWQMESNEKNYSINELIQFQNEFYKLGKRYGLLNEFRENGIPC